MRNPAARALRIALGAIWFALIAQCALAVQTTTISDTVYLANGSPASGTLLISWPTFTTAAGEPVPGGSTTVMVAANGAVSIALAPNAGATPAGAYYTVVMHLNGGPVTTEYWVVPATGTTSLSAIRSKVMPVTRAVPTGTVSVAGLVQKTGDTMQGPLALSADPVLPEQASTKRYVDGTAAGQTAQISSASATATAAQTAASQAQTAASAAQTAANAAQATASQALPKDGSQAMAGKLRLQNGLLAGRSDVIDVLSDTAATGAGNSATCTWNPVNYTGCHDDYAALNAMLTGLTLKNRKIYMAPTSSTAGRCSWYSSQTLHVPNGVTVIGNAETFFSSFGDICFPAGVTGFIVAGSGKVKGLNVRGGSPWDYTNVATYVLPVGFGGNGPAADGIVLGGQSSAEDVTVTGFDRHCLTVDSTQTGGSDGTRIQDADLESCRGDGLNYTGVDSQVGIGSNVFSRNNQLYGIRATNPNAAYGNLFLAGNTSNNHGPPGALLTGTVNGSGTGIVCANGTCVATMSAATTLYANAVGQDATASDVVHVAGTTDATINASIFPVTAVGGGGTTFSFKYPVAETLGGGFTATYNIGNRVWALANQRGGGWGAPGGTHVFINPYAECTDAGGSFFNTGGSSSLVINAQGCAGGYGGVQIGVQGTALRLPQPTHMWDSAGSPQLSSWFGGYNFDYNGATVWTAQNTDVAGATTYSGLGFRRSSMGNASGWWCTSVAGNGGTALSTSPICYPDNLTKYSVNGTATATLNPLLATGAFHVPNGVLNDGPASTTGLRTVFWNQGAAPTTCNANDIFFKNLPTANGYIGWVCLTANTPTTFGFIGAGIPLTAVTASPASTAGYTQVTTTALSSATSLDGGISVYFTPGYNAGMDFGANNTGIGTNTFLLRNFMASNTNYATCFYAAGTAPTAQSSFNNCPFVVTPTEVAAQQPLLIGASGTVITQSTVYSPNITPTAVAAASCADQTFTVPGLVTTDTLSRMIPPSALGNIDIGDAYGSAANTLSIHFCNVTTGGSVTPPAGVYTFRATH